MPNTRLLLASFGLLFATGAQASDWHYMGHVKSSGAESKQFFDAETVTYPAKDLTRVWVKAIQERRFDTLLKAHRQTIVEKSARKIASGYVPRFLKIDAIKAKYEAAELKDAMTEIAIYEVMANEPNIETFSKVYFEIDCVGQRIKLLNVISYSDRGEIKSKKAGSSEEFQFIAPDSNGQRLSQMLCPRA